MKFLVKIYLLVFPGLFANCAEQKLFFLQKTSTGEIKTLLIITEAKNEKEMSTECEVFTDKDLIDEILKFSYGMTLHALSEIDKDKLFDLYLTACSKRRQNFEAPSYMTLEDIKAQKEGETDELANIDSVDERDDGEDITVQTTTESPEASFTPGYGAWPFIFPGTKWCGTGNIAKDYKDLGVLQETDRCCRDHDLCKDKLVSGQTKHNLTNNSSFTLVSCECDQKFHDCLNRINTVIGNIIGNMYFNILGRDCFSKDYPGTYKCKKYRTLFKLKCIEYEKDASAKPVYRWKSTIAYGSHFFGLLR